MTCWTLALLLTTQVAPPAEGGPEGPAALVGRLGSAKFAEREAAASALRALGREALSALRGAREDGDAEVKARSVALLDQLEAELLVGPTMIRLDGKSRTVAATFAEVARQGRLSLNLMPENSPIWAERSIAPARDEPLAFWPALDVLCAEAKVRPILNVQGFGAGVRGAGLNLVAGELPAQPPRSDIGPFRVQLNALHHNRTRAFTPPGADPSGTVADSFYAELQVTAEPRMAILSLGPLALAEATDDLGQSLLPTAPSPGRGLVNAGMPAAGGMTHGFAAFLKSPDRPGRTIKRLVGVMPVVVSARREDPTLVDLAVSRGRSYRAPDCLLVVNDCRPSAKDPGSTTLDVSIRPAPAGPSSSGNGRFMPNDMGYRPMSFQAGLFEILDAQNRPYAHWMPATQQFGPEETRFVVNLTPARGLGPPAKIRFYDTIRASTEVRFDLRDVPLP